jgi:hypothetical protein
MELGDINLEPTITARFVPAGPVDREAFEYLTSHDLGGDLTPDS